ncbi:MAG: valyl-tRNA synthetase [Ilumatobacteraceae bacterium]
MWSWWHEGSLHATSWPEPAHRDGIGDASLLVPVSEVLAAVRRAKTEAKLSQRAAVDELIVEGPPTALRAIEEGRSDLAEAGAIAQFTLSEGPVLRTTVRLAPSTDVKTAH